ncbi:hypothetical protein [Streptomyces sp. NPDC057554]|uniref:hypothetical protein n=1 Tax=Streptomyces sp. NPDC057554 TaxID=3350538 RepID=UPI00369D9A1A
MLGRLVQLGYLSRLGRRATGSKGGAGAYVYQLGRAGRLLLDIDGRLSPNVNNHALMLADTYLELRRAEKASLLAVTDWEGDGAFLRASGVPCTFPCTSRRRDVAVPSPWRSTSAPNNRNASGRRWRGTGGRLR